MFNHDELARRYPPRGHTASNRVRARNVAIIIDETGSMEPRRVQVVNDFNEFIQTLDKDLRVTLTKFNSETGARVIFCDAPVGEVGRMALNDYVPRGGTPLFDAVGNTVRGMQANLTGDTAIVLVISDGEENSSREWTADGIKALVKEREREGWVFRYMGCDLSQAQAVAIGASIGASGQSVSSQYSKGTATRMAFAANSYANSGGSAEVAGAVFGAALDPQPGETPEEYHKRMQAWAASQTLATAVVQVPTGGDSGSHGADPNPPSDTP